MSTHIIEISENQQFSCKLWPTQELGQDSKYRLKEYAILYITSQPGTGSELVAEALPSVAAGPPQTQVARGLQGK